MGILEIIAEQHLGRSVLIHHAELKSRLRKIEEAMEARSASQTSDEEKRRIADIVELCFEYDREKELDERKNILRTLNEITKNELIELPAETIEQWDERVAAKDRPYATLKRKDERRAQQFLKKYFSFRAKTGLKTQADVAKTAGLSRTHVTALESGEHTPQQKTLQKLARAFGVDVTDLM
jgi:DNA-binding XRE family transcriptional regulator